MKNIDFYQEHSGIFKGRQHLINHVDMILGLGNTNWSKGANDRILLIITPDGQTSSLVEIGTLSKDEILKIRSWILRESLFAIEWQQIALMHGENYILPDDIKNNEDINIILDACIDIWMGNSNDISAFAQTTSIVALFCSWNPVVADRIVIRRRPQESEVEALPAAINSHRFMSVRYSADIAWKTFAERICKNEYIKHFLSDMQDNICPVCGKKLENHIVIHHVDYDHRCEFYNSGLKWNITGTRVQPDCERCCILHREWFDECISRLRAVHNSCNYLIDCML